MCFTLMHLAFEVGLLELFVLTAISPFLLSALWGSPRQPWRPSTGSTSLGIRCSPSAFCRFHRLFSLAQEHLPGVNLYYIAQAPYLNEFHLFSALVLPHNCSIFKKPFVTFWFTNTKEKLPVISVHLIFNLPFCLSIIRSKVLIYLPIRSKCNTNDP